MQLKRLPRAVIFGLAAGLLTLLLLNLVTSGVVVAQSQDEPTPTPALPDTSTLEPTTPPTLTPTPLPALQIQAFVELAPNGDLNGNGIVNPGDTVVYTIRIINTGEAPTGPATLIFSYDAAFIAGVAAISEGGLADQGRVAWNFDRIEAGAEKVVSFAATMRGIFPSGRTQVTAAVVLQSGAVELARTTAPSIEVLGPNLRIVEGAFELITDVNENGRVDPGDTVRFVISYQNTGGGPSQEATLSANYPDELTGAIISASAETQDVEGELVWQIGSVPAGGDARSLAFTAVLASEFPAGVITYELPVQIRAGSAVLDARTISVPISGPSLVLTPGFEFLSDADADGLLDVGDLVQITVPVENVGTEAASEVSLVVAFKPGEFEVSSVGQGGALDAEAGTISWTLASLDAGQRNTFSFQALVRILPPGLDSLRVTATVSGFRVASTSRDLSMKADAPRPTPDTSLTPTPVLVTRVQPAQGTGILTGPVIAVLIALFLSFSLLAIVYVASRVLPESAAERQHDDAEARSARARLVRELVEGVILMSILFAVMILGLQNALAQDSINSIIAGIVGYVAGRVASAK